MKDDDMEQRDGKGRRRLVRDLDTLETPIYLTELDTFETTLFEILFQITCT